MPTNIQSYEPAVYAGNGFASTINLKSSGAGLTAATNGLDWFVVPNCLPSQRSGGVMSIGAIHFSISSMGTGATGGNWTIAVKINNVLIPLLQANIAYNSTTPYVSVDTRTNNVGYKLNPGDVLQLCLTGVPSGTLSGGAVGIHAGITVETYGIVS